MPIHILTRKTRRKRWQISLHEKISQSLMYHSETLDLSNVSCWVDTFACGKRYKSSAAFLQQLQVALDEASYFVGTKVFTAPKRSWAKVIFSEACVKNSVHQVGGVHGRGRVWWVACMVGGMHGGGACMAGEGGVCVADTMRYSQWAGGTHPTRMHSCYLLGFVGVAGIWCAT